MKLNHLEHIEDYILTGNMMQAVDCLMSLTDVLTGKPQKHTKISTKYDGAPSVVFGTDPKNGRFFVGTKSVFNKTPKVCYNFDDIETYYDHQPDLCRKLKRVFETLLFELRSSCIPNVGVYQGDLMWTDADKVVTDTDVSFTPNTITYRIKRDAPLGMECAARTLGMVVHTAYSGESIEELIIVPLDHSLFWTSGAVWIDPQVRVIDYGLEQIAANTIIDSVSYIEKTFASIPNRAIYERHGKMMKMFVNYCIRIGEPQPDVAMYQSFLKKREELVLLAEAMLMADVFEKIQSMHRHACHAKKLILKALNKLDNDFTTEVNGRPTAGEGYVVTYHGVMCKLVDRMEFSRLNFANKKFAKVA